MATSIDLDCARQGFCFDRFLFFWPMVVDFGLGEGTQEERWRLRVGEVQTETDYT